MEHWIIIAVITAVVVAAVVFLCCCCWCCCCQSQSNRVNNKPDVERGEQLKCYPVDPNESISNEETDGAHRHYYYGRRENQQPHIYIYNEEEVVDRANSENGTLLWVNKKQVGED